VSVLDIEMGVGECWRKYGSSPKFLEFWSERDLQAVSATQSKFSDLSRGASASSLRALSFTSSILISNNTNMKLLTSLVLPAFIGAASALSDASVYIFQGDEFPNTSTPPTLSREQARLVFAQRLGVSQYHRLGDASEVTLSYINKFGGPQESLFQDAEVQAPELLLIVEGISADTSKPILDAWSSFEPTFTISKPPSIDANKRLVKDFHQQSGQKGNCAFADDINPFDSKCWSGESKVLHFDLADKVFKMGF
jgi:hypothetical protein